VINIDIRDELKKSWIITIKEFRQIFRKRILIIPLFIFPIVMIVFFGYGMGGTVNHVDAFNPYCEENCEFHTSR
jgi:hypothetical protein